MNIIKPAELLFCRLLFLRRCIHRCRRRHGTGARNACGRAQRMRQKIKLSFLATSVITAALALSPEIPGMGEKPAPSSDETAVYAGIDGMTDCVECMRSFYIAGQAKRLESASDEILAGTRALNRCAINRSAFARQVIAFAQARLPEGKDVFFIYTHGAPGGNFLKGIREAASARRCREIGEYRCQGYDTFGPFKLLGGIAKGHPTEAEIRNAVAFYEGLKS